MSPAFAFDEEPLDDSEERRAGRRNIAVLRVGRVSWGDQDQLCVVRNISPGGLMFECLHPPAVGQELILELRSDKQMHGIVRWEKDSTVGVAFEEAIDVEQILKEERSSLLRVRPRSPRFARRGAVRLIGEGEPAVAEIIDISVGGMSCRPDRPLRRGEPIVAVIDGVAATNAEIRWIKGDAIGLRFEKPLPWRPFQLWLDETARQV